MIKTLKLFVNRSVRKNSSAVAADCLNIALPIKHCEAMIDSPVKKHICVTCEHESSETVCRCGSRSFVVGNGIVYREGKVFCGCGNDTFARKNSINQLDLYKKTYKCSHCERAVEVHHYLKRRGMVHV